MFLVDTKLEYLHQWHPTRNGRLTPENVQVGSSRVIWWRAECCGYEWGEPVADRDKYQRWRCPSCRTILDSLAFHDPGLAAEWSPNNPITAWQVRATASTSFIPRWICSVDPNHVWEAPLSGRSNGAECPECRQAGKSRVELRHHAAAKAAFGKARSGKLLRHHKFTTRSTWTADILIELDQKTVIIEYDGSYWHSPAPKIDIDRRKSLDLLAAGYIVVRLRENELPTLGIDDPHYAEIQVYSAVPQPEQVMKQIIDWINSLPAV